MWGVCGECVGSVCRLPGAAALSWRLKQELRDLAHPLHLRPMGTAAARATPRKELFRTWELSELILKRCNT
jgi:hypothetical protein